MEPEESDPVRRLLQYSSDTAGGLMTPEPIVLTPDATIAEALARVRNPDLTPALAAMVFVCRPPSATPTGRYLGCVHIQRLLREPPFELVAGALDTELARLPPDAVADRGDPLLRHLQPGVRPGRRRRRTTCSARSPSTTCWTTCCRRLARRLAGREPADVAGGGPPMPEPLGRRRDSTSRARQPRGFRCSIDPEAFGRFSERLARFLGTGKFLFWQTLLVIIWITLNLVAVTLRWDPYPFILLNLAFSTQAAYAAPLILLAQNRQDDRDRVSLEEDRARAAQTKADTEYLARELAALRLAIGEVATRDYLRGELDRLRKDLNPRRKRAARPPTPSATTPAGPTADQGRRFTGTYKRLNSGRRLGQRPHRAPNSLSSSGVEVLDEVPHDAGQVRARRLPQACRRPWW